jgi:hypothetical protein
MKLIKYSILLALAMLVSTLQGQEVKSGRSSLKISNMPKPEEATPPDTESPVLEFISPKIPVGFKYTSLTPELDLIAKVTDPSGISFVSMESEMQSLSDKGIFTKRLQLAPGINTFRIVCMDQKENMTESDFVVEYIPPVVTLAEKISEESTYYGLIIGINQYRDPEISDLDNPIKDAQHLYNTLVEHYRFDEENMRFLKNPTREDLIRSLDELSHEVTPKDNLLIFYAGHGWWDENADNGWWLPADAEKDVKTNWFRISSLQGYLREINSKHTLLITDACFGGSIFRTRAAFPNREKAYEKLYELPSRKAMTSGNLTEVPDRSSFTKYLVDRLEQNTSTYLSSEELFASFRLAVINNSDAIPMFGEIEKVGDEGGDFIFLRKD